MATYTHGTTWFDETHSFFDSYNKLNDIVGQIAPPQLVDLINHEGGPAKIDVHLPDGSGAPTYVITTNSGAQHKVQPQQILLNTSTAATTFAKKWLDPHIHAAPNTWGKKPLPVLPEPTPQPEPTPPPQPAPEPVSTVVIGGVEMSLDAVRVGIDILTAAAGPTVKAPLVKASHILAIVDLSAVAILEAHRNPGFTGNTKAAVIAHLNRVLDVAASGGRLRGLLTFDAAGYAEPFCTNGMPAWSEQYATAIKSIAAKVGNGRVVGRGRSRMTSEQRSAWLRAWHGGLLDTAYQIEAQCGATPHPLHPGAPGNPDTHRVIWQAAVAGELPAGIWPPGNWSPPSGDISRAEVDNYLIAATMAHPESLAPSHRRSWVKSHLKGDKAEVDALSLRAKKYASQGWHETATPAWSDPGSFGHVALDELLNSATPVKFWHTGALREYLDQYELNPGRLWCDIVEAIQAHRYDVARQQAVENAQLRFSPAPDQPTMTGYHRKLMLVDQHSDRWLFKAVPDTAHRFRAEVEHEAHILARLWGYRTADSRLIEHDGVYGQAQRLFDTHRNLSGVDFTTLTAQQLSALAREHLLDWAIDNDDSHGENIIITTAGTLVGIDKGRAWRYFGGWDGLCGTGAANSNCRLVYTDFYTAIAAGQLPQQLIDDVYRDVITQARRMQRLPDATLADIITRAQTNRPHFKPSSYQRVVPEAPTNLAELITAATARKNNLAADMQTLWQRVYTRAGWALPELTGCPLGVNTQGHPLYAGLHDPQLPAAVAKTKSYGTATFVAGTDIEDAHILLWRERRSDGNYNIRGQFKTRGKSYTRVKKWLADQAVKVDDTGQPPAPPQLVYEAESYEGIIYGAKTVSHHHADGEYNTTKLELMDSARRKLSALSEAVAADIAAGKSDPDGRLAATLEMCQLYLAYIARIDQHKTDHTKSAEGDFPRYVFTPKTPEPAEPDANTVLVEARRASRAAAHLDCTVKLADDGELQLDGTVLEDIPFESSRGQNGYMYLVTLPGGEQIEFRGDDDTETPLSAQGLTQFTIPDPDRLGESLHRIDAQLTTMGLSIAPADFDDLELYYWRHLAGIMNTRLDARKTSTEPHYQEFWKRYHASGEDHQADRAEEIAMWRHAFAALVEPGHVEAFIAAEGHLPRFMHMDLRNPTQPCGKPYWERFDVTDVQWQSKQMPISSYNTGATRACQAGAVFSTEARIRTLAIWKSGMSSAEDMSSGSAAYIFTRNNLEASPEIAVPTIMYSPRILLRTTNYAFDGDRYGRIRQRRQAAYFDFETMSGHTQGSNEMMVKDALSLLDDIEILVFNSTGERDEALNLLRSLGITEIRGIPVTRRLMIRENRIDREVLIGQIREGYRRG